MTHAHAPKKWFALNTKNIFSICPRKRNKRPQSARESVRFSFASRSPALEVRECELKKIKKKWEILKLGLDTGGNVMIGTQSLGKHHGLGAKEHPTKMERGAA